MYDLETIKWMNKKEHIINRPKIDTRHSAWNDIEYTFYKWMAFYGHYMNFKTELRKAGVTYKGVIDMMTKSYIEDPEKENYKEVITVVFDWSLSLYGSKYWTEVHKGWMKYAVSNI